MILQINLKTKIGYLAHTDNINNIVCDTRQWDVVQFDTEEAMLQYITDNNLELQNED